MVQSHAFEEACAERSEVTLGKDQPAEGGVVDHGGCTVEKGDPGEHAPLGRGRC